MCSREVGEEVFDTTPAKGVERLQVSNVCRTCHSQADHRTYEVREMQFGTRERFQ